jgi:hypothetical protein
MAGGASLDFDSLAGLPSADYESVLDLITSTIRPSTWDAAGGPGSIQKYPPTLDFIIAQTDEVHEEIDKLFERLRRLPAAQRDVRPLETVESDTTTFQGDLMSLMDAITSSIRSWTWDASGGPGSISRDEPHMALVVSQTQEVHEDLSRLLMLLRRSRYAAVRGQRPWETAALPAGGPWFGTLGRGISADVRESDLPPPKPGQLESLKVRRVPDDGLWKMWQRSDAGGRKETLIVRRAGDTLEIETPHCIIRTRGDAAAVAWPGLGIVEHGNWGQAIRRNLDAWLPWMPHRSNEELAQWFEVSRMEPKDGDEKAGLVRLRLVPRGFAPESGTYIEAAFRRTPGNAASWQMFVEGKPVGRLEFQEGDDDDIFASPGDVVLRNPEDKQIARWTPFSLSAQPRTAHGLTAGWGDRYVHLDRRGERPLLDAAFHEGLTAMQRGDWPAAYRALQTSAQQHPGHPLLLLLRAECCQHDSELATREQVLAALRLVAAGQARTLRRYIV